MLTELLVSPALWITLAVLAAGWLVYAFLCWRQKFEFFNSLPGEENFSFIWGNLHMFPRPMTGAASFKFATGLLSKNRRWYRFWVGPFRPVIFLFHPDHCKAILQTSEPKPLGIGDTMKLALPWLGEGLVISNGERWYRSRHMLTPAFHFDILRPYVDVYNKAADILCENIDKLADTGKSFDIYPLLKLCTFDIILKCAMSVDLDIQLKGNALYFSDTFYRITVSGDEFYKCCDLVHEFAEDVIDKRRKELEEEGPPQKRYLDFLDILLTAKDESGKGLSKEEIRAEVDTFLFAGHETSSTALSWLLHLLTQNLDYQVRVQEEVESVLKDRDSTDVTWADLSKLETLTCCMKEALRLYPPAPGVLRILTKDMEMDGVTLPAGTRLIAMIMNLHRNPDVWEDPEEFRPERFEKEQTKDRSPYAFVPFSAGPRNCIGQVFAQNEIKVMASKVLFDLTPDPDHPVVPNSAAVLHSETGVWVYANRRILWH
ncbi:hypothetical protein BaRGS_00006868 [Batillaria attramentaria]|uniref:Cytochrome P450 n=1 Tax=Batillaria attramentaria TaxID=370345 RepID=A0ABD0LQR1_9CAEN